MIRMGIASFILLGMGTACTKSEVALNSETAAPGWTPVVQNHLDSFAEDALPQSTAEEQAEVLDLLDLSLSSDKGHHQANHVLNAEKPDRVTSIMLALVEGREANTEIKAEAYKWLSKHGVEAMVPRLTLRFKYEKDWAANVDMTTGLLRFGCGAGLAALITILQTEEGVNDLDHARWSAIAALRNLPPAPGWVPGENFDSDWQRLLTVEREWRSSHVLSGFEDSPAPSRGYRAEIWKTLAKFRSQPLRPVDDARFVLMRQATWAFPAIVETTYDENGYVREHALQTLAWTGSPIGVWATRTDFDLAGQLAPLLGDGRLRGRVLEAMGASGLSVMQNAILPWLREGNREESTAAADALLRCANRDILRPIESLLASSPTLSPEGHYALECLRHALDQEYVKQTPVGVDPSEISRRNRWASERQ
ncbi:MAG: hypothetical protein QM477_03245 [Planctomycetota bacterium]